jgi:hypothetical protein
MCWKTIFVLCSLVAFLTVAAMVAATPNENHFEVPPIAVPSPHEKPPFSAYRAVEIGMSTVDARKAFGSPKEKADAGDYFEFSENESAQVYYDSDHKVRAISITFTGKLDKVPTPNAVFGEDAEVKSDGGIFKMERYPKAGFWISYTRTGGDDPMVIIALQKI